MSDAAVIAARLAELRTELGKGREELVALERRRGEVRDTVLRIGGAIQVLEELTATENGQVLTTASP